MDFFTVENLVWTLFAAILAAILYLYCMQRILSDFAKKIIETGADCEEKAKTLADLGYKDGFRAFLTGFFADNGNYISKAVKKIRIGNETKNSELLFEEKAVVKYYIPVENNDNRLKKHINDGISLTALVCLVALLVAIAVSATTIMGWLGRYTANSLSGDKAYGVEKEEHSLLEEQAKANKQDELEKKKQQELERIEQQAQKELEEALKSQNNPT